METWRLEDHWTMRSVPGNPLLGAGERFAVRLPATVYGTLVENGRLPDPYGGEDEAPFLEAVEYDYIFETAFSLDARAIAADALTLVLYGVDTLAEVFLNGIALGETDNMHRTWRFDITAVASRDNVLRVVLRSPTAFLRDRDRGPGGDLGGISHLRKAHAMFGSRSTFCLPDMGIFRPVEVIAHRGADLGEVRLYQEHVKTGRGVHGYIIPEVRLHVTTEVRVYEAGEPVSAGSAEELAVKGLRVAVEVESPDGAIYHVTEGRRGRILDEEQETGVRQVVRIPDPKLWWPAGYGDHPLYTVRLRLMDDRTGEELDRMEKRIGLRILTVNRDARGERDQNFAFKVNGLQIFARGASLLPEDQLLSRVGRDRTEKLLREAVRANCNMLRVWGGGYYPDDDLYDLCDELGLILWQDLMFADQVYDLDAAFEAQILAELRDNVRRLRYHACLGLWCGNSEGQARIEGGFWDLTPKQRADYIKIFEYLIPGLLAAEDPDTQYWPSSPSSGVSFRDPQEEGSGDVHYWELWNRDEPYASCREHSFRFVSEFGFQSLPCLRTLYGFAAEEERNLFSRRMEYHQRDRSANAILMGHLARRFLYPRSLGGLVHATQLMQAEAVRSCVEHFRRHRGETMGALVWQFNDSAPVISWSSIDHYGNRKAVYYAERRVFAPLLLSCEERGGTDAAGRERHRASLHVANETSEPLVATVVWQIRGADSRVLSSGEETVQALPYDGAWLAELDLDAALEGSEAPAAFDPREMHLAYGLYVAGEERSGGVSLYCPPKHYRFRDPSLELSVEGDRVSVRARAFAMGVCIMDGDRPAVLEDNFFDMEAGLRTLRLEEPPEGALTVRCVRDIA